MVSGACYQIEAALLADGATAPALTFLSQMRKGQWRDDTAVTKYPDTAQVAYYHKLLSGLKTFAEHDRIPYGGFVNYLTDGIWEFKLGTARLTFYDTAGDGICIAKPKIKDVREVQDPRPDYWWLPRFDEFIRIGHYWSKDGQRAKPADIDRALQMREEDLAHDRQG